MKNSIRKIMMLTITFVIFFSASAIAAGINASIAMMPVYAESMDKGVLVDLVKAIREQSKKMITYQVVPFKRSMNDVIHGRVDFHMPLIQNPDLDEATLDYDHSTATIFHVNFVLYTQKGKPVDKSNIANYRIETDAAHVSYFHSSIIPSSNIESSLKRVNIGRIDGFIFADNASDPIVKKLILSNIKRELYRVFDVKIILPKGKRGQAVDNMLTTSIDAMKKSGKYQKIMSIIDAPYDDWQP